MQPHKMVYRVHNHFLHTADENYLHSQESTAYSGYFDLRSALCVAYKGLHLHYARLHIGRHSILYQLKIGIGGYTYLLYQFRYLVDSF